MIADGPNLAQVEYWNGRTGNRWTEQQDALDHALGPLGRAALERAAPRPAERALDVGCGCGATAIELGRLVGPTGDVRAVDVSAPMLARARARVGTGLAGHAPITFEEADAATLAPVGDRDLVFSRFGVMFFADPVAAFARLRGVARRGGRLAFVCWRGAADNPWASIPIEAVTPHLEPEPPAEPGAPGPFALADEERTRALLARAGWQEIAIAAHDTTLAWTTSPSLDDAVALFTQIGPASRRLTDATDEARAQALAALRAALAPHVGPEGLRLGGAAWLVTARA